VRLPKFSFWEFLQSSPLFGFQVKKGNKSEYSKIRSKATTIGALANQLGIGFGFILSPLIVRRKHTEILGMEVLLIFQAFMTFIILVVSVLFVESKPKHPPSGSADESNSKIGKSSEDNFIQRFWRHSFVPMVNKDFFILWIGFGIAVGGFYAVSTLLDQFLNPLGYNETFSGIIGLTIIISGAISCILALFFPIRFGQIIFILLDFLN
jgi:MFS transporter, FLVCR family, feline leukemia virus subgroup C receptor-related protein